MGLLCLKVIGKQFLFLYDKMGKKLEKAIGEYSVKNMKKMKK